MSEIAHHNLFYDCLLTLKQHSDHPSRFHRIAARPTSNFSQPHPGPSFRLAGVTEMPAAPRRILGIAALYHDASAALIVDGDVIAAAQEDRFSRRNHDSRFPYQAISFCLAQAGLAVADLDLVAYYEEPFLKVDRVVQSLMATSPRSRESFQDRRAIAIQRDIALQVSLAKSLDYEGPICFVQHHISHAASAFYLSPFDEAACLIVDGIGEWATTTLAIAGSQGIRVIEQIDYPHSLGLFYSTLTAYLGFTVNNDEYKVMALSAYGRPTYRDKLQQLVHLFSDGSFALDLTYFSFPWDNKQLYQESLAPLLGIPPRPAQGTLGVDYTDLACSLQEITEEALRGLLSRLYELTALPNLVMAGGVAFNSVANYKAFQASPFKDIFIQPAAGDGGGSLGAALYAYYNLGAGHTSTDF